MTNDMLKIDLEELKNIAFGLISKSKSISDEYQNNIYSAIGLGTECIEVSGLEISKIYEILNQTYKNISDRCMSLANYITNNIVPNYSTVSSAISNNFNNQLGAQINSLLGIVNIK